MNKLMKPVGWIVLQVVSLVFPIVTDAAAPTISQISFGLATTPKTITLTGTGYLSTTVVKLSGSTLTKVSQTSTTYTANLPNTISAGDFLLTAANGTSSVSWSLSYGQVGPQGPQGAQGATGPAGPSGPQGVAGPVGATGSVGPAGPQGPAGLQGSAGPQGAKGDPGLLAPGSVSGALAYWNGTSWAEVAPPTGNDSFTLKFCNGAPKWQGANAPLSAQYQVGQTGPAGGVVFHVAISVTACAGDPVTVYEASPVNLESNPWGQQWGCLGAVVGTSTALGSGPSNTALLALAGCAGPGTAIQLAHDYRGSGFSDWYLPSRDELLLLHSQRGFIPNWINCLYFSSSEGSGNGWNIGPGFGVWVSEGIFHRDTYGNECVGVRAIRSFQIPSGS
jgi:hypothetical protein